MKERVKVELREATLDGIKGLLPFRIFRNTDDCNKVRGTGVTVIDWELSHAVHLIRRQVFERDQFQCVHCGAFVTWLTGQMDERVSRGDGGEVSVENGQTLCAKCHIVGPKSKHGKERSPRFSKAPSK